MTSAAACTVAVIEDHPLMRAAVIRAVSNDGARVVAEAASADEGYRLATAARPDVAVVDIVLGSESGVALTRRLIRHDAHLGVIMYTGSEDVVTLKDALDCGARGFVFKTSGIPVLLAAVRSVCAGGTYVDAETRSHIVAIDPTAVPRVLTDREREILELLSQCLTGDETAGRLALSPETVKTHVRNAAMKLGAQNRTHAVVLALRNGELRL